MSNSIIVLTLTPKRNLENGQLIDPINVKVEKYDWDQKIKIYNWCTLIPEVILAHEIDVENHYIPIENQDYKIISLFSGPEDVCGENGTYYNNRRKELGLPYKEIERNRPFGKLAYA